MLDLIRPRKSSAPSQECEPAGNQTPPPAGSVPFKLAGRWLVILFCLAVWLGIAVAVMMS